MEVLKPLSNHSIEQDFVSVYQHAMDHVEVPNKVTPSRVLFVRPSQMPFCPLSFFINHAMKGLRRSMDMRGAFYTSVGTTVHEVMQTYLCRSGRFLADYECRECGKMHRLSYKTECCGFFTQYHEVEINYKGVHGHIDAVYRDKQGRLWILDFKTTSVEGAPKKKKNPGENYKEQIKVYAVLFELQYKMKIEGIMDAFILRNNPKKDPAIWAIKMTDQLRKEVRIKLTRYKRMHAAAIDTRTLPQALALIDYGRCKDEYCKICKLPTADIKKKLKLAHESGVKLGNVPIRALAERALASEAANKRKHKHR